MGTVMALKAVLIDSNAVARATLNTVLSDGGYDVCGQSNANVSGLSLVQKHQPQLVYIAHALTENGGDIVAKIRASCPKILIFMVGSALDAATVQAAHAQGVAGFIVQPFKADVVLKTIRATLLATVRRQQAAQAAQTAQTAQTEDSD
jgi:two-component system chemotaxis response regulator CheY